MYKHYLSKNELEDKLNEILEIDENFRIYSEDEEYFTIEKKDKVIAYAQLKKREGNYLLQRIFVKNGERFKSYGTKLMNFVLNKGIKKGDIVIENYQELEGFLKKRGFKKEHDRYLIKDIEKKDDRKKEGNKAIYSSVFWNIILAGTKISFGIIGKSKALLADGFNSLSDIGTSLGILLGMHFSNIPEDEDHPFGHERIESVIGIGIGIFMILTAFELFKGGIESLIKGEFSTTPSFVAIIFAVFSSIVKYFMYKQKMRIGLETKNSALIADAKDSRNDVFSSLGVVFGIILSIKVNPIFDIIIGIIISILIFKEGVHTILETTDTILDKQDTEFIDEIKNYIYENTDIKNVHDIYMRKSGDRIFLQFHIRVPKDMTVFEAHKIADELSLSIIEDFEFVKSVDIHLDSLMN